MKISYKKLWKLLIDKDLMEKASISTSSIRRLNNSESVTIEVLGRICKVLDCTLDDICEFIDTDEE